VTQLGTNPGAIVSGSSSSTGPSATIRTTALHLYLSATNGNDANDGLTPATAVATLARVYSLILGSTGTTYLTTAPIVVHVGSGSYLYTPTPPLLEQLEQSAMLVFWGDGAGQPGEDGWARVSAPLTCDVGTTGAQFVSAAPFAVDAWREYSVRFLDGPCAGYLRLVRNNSTNTIFPVASTNYLGPYEPAPGDTMEIVRPAARFVLQQPTTYLNGAPSITQPTLALVNIGFDFGADFELRISGGNVVMFGVEAGDPASSDNKNGDLVLDGSTVNAGQTFMTTPALDELYAALGIADRTTEWWGWGLSCAEPALSGQRCSFVGHLTTRDLSSFSNEVWGSQSYWQCWGGSFRGRPGDGAVVLYDGSTFEHPINYGLQPLRMDATNYGFFTSGITSVIVDNIEANAGPFATLLHLSSGATWCTGTAFTGTGTSGDGIFIAQGARLLAAGYSGGNFSCIYSAANSRAAVVEGELIVDFGYLDVRFEGGSRGLVVSQNAVARLSSNQATPASIISTAASSRACEVERDGSLYIFNNGSFTIQGVARGLSLNQGHCALRCAALTITASAGAGLFADVGSSFTQTTQAAGAMTIQGTTHGAQLDSARVSVQKDFAPTATAATGIGLLATGSRIECAANFAPSATGGASSTALSCSRSTSIVVTGSATMTGGLAAVLNASELCAQSAVNCTSSNGVGLDLLNGSKLTTSAGTVQGTTIGARVASNSWATWSGVPTITGQTGLRALSGGQVAFTGASPNITGSAGGGVDVSGGGRAYYNAQPVNVVGSVADLICGAAPDQFADTALAASFSGVANTATGNGASSQSRAA